MLDSELRKERMRARDGLTDEEIEKRFKLQLSDEEKAQRADVILENNGTMDELYKNLCIAWERLTGLKLASIHHDNSDSR